MIYDYFHCLECGYTRVSEVWLWRCPLCAERDPGPLLASSNVLRHEAAEARSLRELQDRLVRETDTALSPHATRRDAPAPPR